MNTVSHHGRDTSYQLSDRDGSGPTLLCIHGSGGNHGVWKAQARLSDQYPVAAVDLSGHGESDDIDADPGYGALSAYADDVLAVADAVDADVLVGSSLGGAVALHVALERTYPLDGLVLAGTGAKLGVLDDLLTWLDSEFERAVEFLHGPDRLFHDPDDRLLDLSRSAMHDTGQSATRRDFRTCHEFDVRDRLDEIGVPTLAVVGEHDQLTPPWYHERLASDISTAALATIEDAAHLAMLERPNAFNTALDSFLEWAPAE